MIRFGIALSALGLALVPAAAMASTTPTGSIYDGRIQSVAYQSGQVFIVHTAVGIGTSIVLGADEDVLDMASGFSQAWEIVNKRNIIYIKPKSVAAARVDDGNGTGAGGLSGVTMPPKPAVWRTNLLITTNKRLYAFDLYVGSPMRAAYRVEFSYPEEIAAKAAAARAASLAATLPIEVTDMDSKAPALNYAYTMQVGRAAQTITPTAAWDDGRFTYIRFSTSKDLPSVFLRKENREEEIVNSHVEALAKDGEEDTIVVHGVYHQLALRSGSSVVFVNDEKYGAATLAPLEGTTVPGVRRVIKGDLGTEKVLAQ